MSRIRKIKNGFTLIELLLVTGVIGIMVLYAAQHLRTNVQEQQLLDTKVEFENWLQAITNFYITNESWPSDINQLTTNDAYINASAVCSLWPGTGNSTCSNKSLFRLACPNASCRSTNNYMGIELTVPSKEIAQRLIAILPSSEAANDATTVQAYVSVPSVIVEQNAAEQFKWGWIEGGGIIQSPHDNCVSDWSGSYITMPKCPAGYEGHFMQFFLKQRTGRLWVDNLERLIPIPIPTICEKFLQSFNNKCCRKHNRAYSFINLTAGTPDVTNPDKPTVPAILYQQVPRGEWNYAFDSYITFCIPNGTWYPGDGAISTDNEGTQRDPRQCTAEWLTYNPGTSCNSATDSRNYR